MDKETFTKITDIFQNLENDAITTKDIERFLTFTLKTIKEANKNIVNFSDGTIDKIQKIVSIIDSQVTDIENKERNISKEIAEVKDFLRVVKKMKAKKGKDGADGINGKDGSPDTPDEVVEKINKSDKKIKSDKIEGVEKFVDKANMDRAIDILDQRTRFLINKPAGTSSGGGSFATLTGEPTDNTNLAIALDSKADKTFAIAMAIALG